MSNYLNGLAEGRKEKENEQLKAQIEQLSNDNHVLKTSFITQQEQIEKMKCCENCKHYVCKIMNDGDTKSMCGKLKGAVCFSNNYEDWELAE